MIQQIGFHQEAAVNSPQSAVGPSSSQTIPRKYVQGGRLIFLELMFRSKAIDSMNAQDPGWTDLSVDSTMKVSRELGAVSSLVTQLPTRSEKLIRITLPEENCPADIHERLNAIRALGFELMCPPASFPDTSSAPQ